MSKLDHDAGSYQMCTVLKRNPFIIPPAPVLKREPPKGEQWIHEVTFDGSRARSTRPAMT